MFQPLNAKVEAPNYHFDLDSLSVFYPGQPLNAIQKKYGKGEVMSESGGIKTFKFQVKETRYQFPVIIQVENEKVLDFFARLPSYFLHDVFFQSLRNRLGKQDVYKKYGEEAFYTWEKNSIKYIYSAACTITCFPIFYSAHPVKMSTDPLMKKMQKANTL